MNHLLLLRSLRNPTRLIPSTTAPPSRASLLPTLFHPTTIFRKTTARMCQGCVPEYFEFKQSPAPLPQNWLNSRFLTQATDEKDKDIGTDSFEYRVAHDAPCPIIDAHVHVFPQKLMEAVWTFFDNFYWPVRYKKNYIATRADFLLDQGVRHVVLLVYAHKNGIARDLNKFLAHTVNSMNERYASLPQPNGQPKRGVRVASGLATVMPGEPDARAILAEAFTTLGLSGIKMHSHVQCVAANHPSMDEVYETCIEFDKPVLIHAGKEPNSKAYKVDAGKICDFSIVEDVLRRYPRLRICIPHLGMNQYEEFFHLLDKYPNLYLDTTMTLGAFFQSLNSPSLPTTTSSSCSSSTCDHTTHTTNNNNNNSNTSATPTLKPMAEMLRTMLLRHSDRILYGTDWPNIPYDWCRELANLVSLVDGDGEATAAVGERVRKEEQRTKETDVALENILWRNASRFYRISEHDLGLAPLSPNL